MWCGNCYTSGNKFKFHVHGEHDEAEDVDLDVDRLEESWIKQTSNEYHHARNGDHLMVPFECDLCVFRLVTTRNPNLHNARDCLLLAVIRRCILDSFWSRATSTMESNARRMRKLIQVGYEDLGMGPPFFEPGLRT